MFKKKRDIHSWGDNVEVESFVLIKKVINRLLDGYFHFKKRKGDMMAGSATFFTLLSFGPVLLTLISFAGFFFDNATEAKQFVLQSITNFVPNLAPSIISSIDQIITTQLAGDNNFGIINFIVLAYASMGVIASMNFGLKNISNSNPGGGFLIEDLKSFASGVSVSAFMGMFFLVSSPIFMKKWLASDNGYLNKATEVIIDYNVISIVSALLFFTMYYAWSTPSHIRMRESFKGACAFVTAFMIGKSFYWVYHLYTKETMTQSFGNFYTVVVAVLWIYFLMCAFFYGASVACVNEKDIYQGKISVEETTTLSLAELQDSSDKEAS